MTENIKFYDRKDKLPCEKYIAKGEKDQFEIIASDIKKKIEENALYVK